MKKERNGVADPDPESGSAIRKNAGSGSVSGSALNQCGSATLRKNNKEWCRATKPLKLIFVWSGEYGEAAGGAEPRWARRSGGARPPAGRR
jgi:hypothetical protein